MLYLSGNPTITNLINRSGASPALTVSPTSNGAAYAADGDASSPVVSTTAAVTDGYYRFSVQQVTDAGFEGGALGAWTDNDSGGGASTVTAGSKRSGTYGLDQTPGAGTAEIYSNAFSAKAGEWRKASAWVNPLSGAPTTVVSIMCLETGNYLHSDGTWSATPSKAATMSKTGVGTPGFVEITKTYQVEALSVTGSDTVTLRWYVYTTNAQAYIDDCSDMPGVNFVSIHGHNYPMGGRITPKVQTSTDGTTFSTTVATMTLRRGEAYISFAMTYSPYWQLKIEGTTLVAPAVGEIMFGQVITSATGILWGATHTRTFPGMREVGPSGRIFVYNYSTTARRNLKMSFLATTDAASAELLDNMWGVTEQGRYPTIIVPDAAKADVVFGRLAAPVETTENYRELRTTLELFGDPMPSIGL